MPKYLIKSLHLHRPVSVGRLRWKPGQQMWVDGELHGSSKVQSLLASGQLEVLQVRGLPEPEPEEPQVEEPSEPAEVAVEPEMEDEPLVLTESQLSSMRVAELRELATTLGVSWSGLRKAELVDAILNREA